MNTVVKSSSRLRLGSPAYTLILLLTCVVLTGCYAPRATTDNLSNQSQVKTKFVLDAELSTQEINQIVELAKKCGISEVESVETFNSMPTGQRGIFVNSKERVSGRTITHDTLGLDRSDWSNSKPDSKASQLGLFWVRAPMYTTTLREFKVGNENLRVAIGEGIEMAFADKVIPLILTKNVSFKDEHCKIRFQETDISKPLRLLNVDSNHNEYRMIFNGPLRREICFKVENEEVIVTVVGVIMS